MFLWLFEAGEENQKKNSEGKTKEYVFGQTRPLAFSKEIQQRTLHSCLHRQSDERQCGMRGKDLNLHPSGWILVQKLFSEQW